MNLLSGSWVSFRFCWLYFSSANIFFLSMLFPISLFLLNLLIYASFTIMIIRLVTNSPHAIYLKYLYYFPSTLLLICAMIKYSWFVLHHYFNLLDWKIFLFFDLSLCLLLQYFYKMIIQDKLDYFNGGPISFYLC